MLSCPRAARAVPSDDARPRVTPPMLYGLALAVSVASHAVSPWPLVEARPLWTVLGSALLVAGAALARVSFLALRQARTLSVSGHSNTDALVERGPFRRSRNPVYVAMTALYLGFVVLINTGWGLLMLVPLLGVMNVTVIRREEAHLAARFGPAYRAYCARVRRWL